MKKKYKYKIEHFYPGFDQKKFFNMFVDHEAWTKSDLLPGDITILKPGKVHSQGLGAVRQVISGNMTIIEDIVGFESPNLFQYSSRNGSMPVNDFGGMLVLVPKDDGVLAKYEGGFNTRYFGTGRLFRFLFRRGQKTAFANLEKAYNSYYA